MSPMSPRLLRPRSSGGATDADARAYIQSVQAADGQSLEPAVVIAIDNFVIGLKADNIWSKIGTCCILMGGRTLNGILTPLKGAAPTSNAFVGDATDYNRKAGLIGNATAVGAGTKYLDTNRAPTDDAQNDNHMAVYVSAASVGNSTFPRYIGNTNFHIGLWSDASQLYMRNNASTTHIRTPGSSTGFIGNARSSSANFETRVGGSTTSPSPAVASTGRGTGDHGVFGSSTGSESSARIAFFSIGAHLDLALLDTRVSALYAAIGSASLT